MPSKIIPIFVSGVVLSFVIWQVKPPEDLSQASITQILLLFIPLISFFIFTVNLFLKFILKSIIVSLLLTTLLIFKALGLNPITLIAILGAVAATFKYLKKNQKNPYQAKIPKLSQLRKQ